MIDLNKKMVAYGNLYITLKECDEWHVTKSGKDHSVLFSGTYDECIKYCKKEYTK